tara:strand:- start:52 stop:336 length:285 start_codon:yes stop_codon:yes gene_type:complete
MNVNYFMLENHLKQKLTTLNGDLQFFRDILNDCKKSDDKELNTEIPNHHLIYNAIEQLENSIKVLKDELTENNIVKNRALLDRFRNLQKVSEVK